MAIRKALGLSFLEFANTNAIQDFPSTRRQYKEAIEKYLSYRAIYDLRRGWRVIPPPPRWVPSEPPVLSKLFPLLSVSQLMQAGFNPSSGFCFILPVQVLAQFPQVLSAVEKIQQLPGSRPAIGSHVPDPRASVGQHQLLLGAGQTLAQSLPVQSPSQFGQPQ